MPLVLTRGVNRMLDMRHLVTLALLASMPACADPGTGAGDRDDGRYVPVAYREAMVGGRVVRVVSVPAADVCDALAFAICESDCETQPGCADAVIAACCAGGWCADDPYGGLIEAPSLEGWLATWDDCFDEIDQQACDARGEAMPGGACATLAPGW